MFQTLNQGVIFCYVACHSFTCSDRSTGSVDDFFVLEDYESPLRRSAWVDRLTRTIEEALYVSHSI